MNEREAILWQLARDYPDLTARQVGVLLICRLEAHSESSRQVKTIAENLKVDRPVVTRAGDKLYELGYLKRSEIAGDRRTCVLTLTAKGGAMLGKVLGETPPPARPKVRLPRNRGESLTAS